MITQAIAEHFAKEWIESWNTHDMDRILSHYTDDFEMSSPVITRITDDVSGTLKEKDNVRTCGARRKTDPRAPHCHLRCLYFPDVDPPESRAVEAIQVHHLVPGRHKVMDKLLSRVRRRIDFGHGAQLGV